VAWRTSFTILSFFFFGIGALMLSLFVLPLIHLCYRDRAAAQQASRGAVRSSFRLFIWFMSSTGVLDYKVSGSPEIAPGSLVIANHPSLIDVIFIIAHIPDALCVVKEELDHNLFTRLIVRTTGYPTSEQPERLIGECVRLLENGARIVMFPEGTRTVPGRSPAFRRGAANVLSRALCPLTPIFLNIVPPTLAKGERWFRVPPTKVRYFMEIGQPIDAERLLAGGQPGRHSVRACTEKMKRIYSSQLSNRMTDGSGADDEHGKPADGYQSPDREYSRT